MSSQVTDASESASFVEDTQRLNLLNALYKALSEYLASHTRNTHGSGAPSGESNLSSFSTLLSKLALVCDTRKGRDTISALVALVGDAGQPVITLTSNHRKEHEFIEIVNFLQDLFQYVEANPQNLNNKPLQKQVLWRILEKCQNKIDGYLVKIIEVLPPCLEDCEGVEQDVIELLEELQDKTRDVKELRASQETREQYLRRCEILIRAIVANKLSPLEQLINRKANGENATPSDSDSDEWLDLDSTRYIWSDLRHCIGRLHSYRQAAEVIMAAKEKWPEFLREVEIQSVPSGQRKKRQLVKFSNVEEILLQALPEADLHGLLPPEGSGQDADLRKFIEKEWKKGNFRLYVHAEMQLHKYLVEQERTSPEHFWQNDPFIATSKPPCRLCHEYFQTTDHSFHVQSSHGNFYTAWRLPGLDDDGEMAGEMIDWMEDETLRLLRDGQAAHRRYDSRTESNLPSSLANRNESRTTSSLSQASGRSYGGHGRQEPRQHDFQAIPNNQGFLIRQSRSDVGVRQSQAPTQNYARGPFTPRTPWPIKLEAGAREHGHMLAGVDEGEEDYVTEDFEGVENGVGVRSAGAAVTTGY